MNDREAIRKRALARVAAGDMWPEDIEDMVDFAASEVERASRYEAITNERIKVLYDLSTWPQCQGKELREALDAWTALHAENEKLRTALTEIIKNRQDDVGECEMNDDEYRCCQCSEHLAKRALSR